MPFTIKYLQNVTMEQIDILHVVGGILGVVLVVNTILVLIYPSYYSCLSRSFFIEPISEKQKEATREFIEKNVNSDRYLTSIVSLALAAFAIVWAFGQIKSVTVPFFSLAVLVLASRYLLVKRK